MLFPAAMLIACGGETESSTENNTDKDTTKVEEAPAPEVQYQPDTTAEQTITDYLAKKQWVGERHESGMYIVTEAPGEGTDRPDLNDEVTIFYKGYLLNDTLFDGTTTEPATFPLSNLITGWQLGIPMFGKGGKGKLVIPPGLAYGPDDLTDQDGSVLIPGNSVLMFEIELVDWKKAQPQTFW